MHPEKTAKPKFAAGQIVRVKGDKFGVIRNVSASIRWSEDCPNGIIEVNYRIQNGTSHEWFDEKDIEKVVNL